MFIYKGHDIPNTFFLIFSAEPTALPKMGPVFLRNCNCLGVKAGGFFIWVVFFLLFLVTASRAFLAPNEAPPPRAPNPMALPPAMNAGTSAAKGRRPPFCLFDVLLLVPLHLFFLLWTMMSSCKLRVYWYNDDGWCVVFIGEGYLQFEFSFSGDNISWQFFHTWFFTRKCIDGVDHFQVSFPFVSYVFGIGIVYNMLFGDSVQTIDTRITTCESFLCGISHT